MDNRLELYNNKKKVKSTCNHIFKLTCVHKKIISSNTYLVYLAHCNNNIRKIILSLIVYLQPTYIPFYLRMFSNQ